MFEFFDLEFKYAKASRYADWPNSYKFTGIDLKYDVDLKVIERSTYSLLDWLGDVGGLYDGLKLIGTALVSPFA